jgi:hypothetical protein
VPGDTRPCAGAFLLTMRSRSKRPALWACAEDAGQEQARRWSLTIIRTAFTELGRGMSSHSAVRCSWGPAAGVLRQRQRYPSAVESPLSLLKVKIHYLFVEWLKGGLMRRASRANSRKPPRTPRLSPHWLRACGRSCFASPPTPWHPSHRLLLSTPAVLRGSCWPCLRFVAATAAHPLISTVVVFVSRLHT